MAKNEQPKDNGFKPLPLSEDYQEAGIKFDPSQVESAENEAPVEPQGGEEE